MFIVCISFKGLSKFRVVCTDGPVFRLHSQWTVLFLLSCSIFLSCRQHFGDPISCVVGDFPRLAVFENFCWVHPTFILTNSWNSTTDGRGPYPGIDRYNRDRQKTYLAYYQWVALVLFLQGIFFYLPRYVWNSWERGMMKSLALNLHLPSTPSEEAEKNVQLLAHSLHLHWGHFSNYLRKYIFCEALTLANVILQMWLLDKFLGGTFATIGIDVARWTEWDREIRTDPLAKAFPRMSQCRFHQYGRSGDVQRYEALCILTLNILHEKIFLFLWFWMVTLLGLTVAVLLYRLLLSVMPVLRYNVLVLRASAASKEALEKLMSTANIGDWFVLYMLSKNVSAVHFTSVVSKLVEAKEQKGDSIPSIEATTSL